MKRGQKHKSTKEFSTFWLVDPFFYSLSLSFNFLPLHFRNTLCTNGVRIASRFLNEIIYSASLIFFFSNFSIPRTPVLRQRLNINIEFCPPLRVEYQWRLREDEEEGKEEQDISKVFIARTSSSVSSKYRRNGSTERIKSRVLLSGFLCISLGTK